MGHFGLNYDSTDAFAYALIQKYQFRTGNVHFRTFSAINVFTFEFVHSIVFNHNNSKIQLKENVKRNKKGQFQFVKMVNVQLSTLVHRSNHSTSERIEKWIAKHKGHCCVAFLALHHGLSFVFNELCLWWKWCFHFSYHLCHNRNFNTTILCLCCVCCVSVVFKY